MLDEKDSDLLVVDEDDRTREAAQVWLRRQGYDAHCLSSGWSALRFLEHHRPKYAVLDVTTLGDEGLDVLETIRQEPTLRDLPLVVHVSTPDAGGAGGFTSHAYLTRGIDWPGRRAEAEKYLQ